MLQTLNKFDFHKMQVLPPLPLKNSEDPFSEPLKKLWLFYRHFKFLKIKLVLNRIESKGNYRKKVLNLHYIKYHNFTIDFSMVFHV